MPINLTWYFATDFFFEKKEKYAFLLCKYLASKEQIIDIGEQMPVMVNNLATTFQIETAIFFYFA